MDQTGFSSNIIRHFKRRRRKILHAFWSQNVSESLWEQLNRTKLKNRLRRQIGLQILLQPDTYDFSSVIILLIYVVKNHVFAVLIC